MDVYNNNNTHGNILFTRNMTLEPLETDELSKQTCLGKNITHTIYVFFTHPLTYTHTAFTN